MPKFTFHMPVHDHDEIEVEAKDLEDARNKLGVFVKLGQYNGVKLKFKDIDDGPRYFRDDIWDCPVFNEDGDQLDA